MTRRPVSEITPLQVQRGRPQHSWLPWAWTGIVFLAGVALLGVGPVAEQDGWALWVLLPTVFMALGTTIASRRPGNRIAWLLMIAGLFPLFDAAADARVGAEPDPPELLDYLALYWDNIGMWVTFVIPVFLILFWFPTGQFISRRWVWAGWVAGVVGAIATFVGLFSEAIGRFAGWTIENPIGFLPFSGLQESGGLQVAFAAGLASLLIGGLVALGVRYRRSGTTCRRQIRWVGGSLILVVLVLVAMTVFDQWDNQLVTALGYISLILLPVTITFTISRLEPESPPETR